jgi:DNA-binding protein HU-beta
MNKQELVSRVAEISGVDKKEVEHVLNVERDVIIDTLQGGEDIFNRGFGSFQIKARAARVARNPKTDEKIYVPEKKVVKFKPAFKLN